ncbi:hypothetical protein CF327_g6445 [Tilletia walkeri]|nr:hypothetical protein CF327_g6445 [Tilletia walkeri]
MNSTLEPISQDSLGVPLGGIPGPQSILHPDIIFLALYNILFIGILARYFASSTTLAYTWRPALFSFMRIFVFCLRIWLTTHDNPDDTAARHKFIAQALLIAAAPLILLSAALMLFRNASRAYRPSRKSLAGRKQRNDLLRILTYVLDFGLLCMGILFCEAAIGYTDALQGSVDDIRRLRNVWRITSVYLVLTILACVLIVLVLAIQYSMGKLNLDRIAHPELEGRKLGQLTLLNCLIFIVCIYKAAQVDKSSAQDALNGAPAFYGGYCLMEFLAAACFPVFNYERLMPKSSRLSRSSSQDGASKSSSGAVKSQGSDPEKGPSIKDTRRVRNSQDLRILALGNQTKQNTTAANRDSYSTPEPGKKKIGRIERASSIFHERLRRASQASISEEDGPMPQGPMPPPLYTVPQPLPDSSLRYKLAAQVRRQEQEDERDSPDESEIFQQMPTPVTIPAPQSKDLLDPRRRLQRAIETRGQHEQRQNSDSVTPGATRTVEVARPARSLTAWDNETPREAQVNQPLSNVAHDEVAAKPHPIVVDDHSSGYPSPRTIPKHMVNKQKPPASPSRGGFFRRMYKGPHEDEAQSPRGSMEAVPRPQPNSRLPHSARPIAPDTSDDEEPEFSNVSLSTPTVHATPRPKLPVVTEGSLHRSESSTSSHASSMTATSSRSKSSVKRNRDVSEVPPSADMSSLHSFHLGEFTPTPRQVRPEMPVRSRDRPRRRSSTVDRNSYYV